MSDIYKLIDECKRNTAFRAHFSPTEHMKGLLAENGYMTPDEAEVFAHLFYVTMARDRAQAKADQLQRASTNLAGLLRRLFLGGRTVKAK